MPEEATSKSLPALSILFQESWTTFKGSLLNLFILYLISFGIFLGIFIIGLLTALPLGLFSIMSAVSSNEFNPTTLIASLGTLGIIILILIIVSYVINLAINAAAIMAVADYKSKPSAGALFKKGFSFVLPLFLANILLTFIIGGGYFLFIIPGIIFAVAFSFTIFEIVLQKKSVLAAMRRSMGIVFSNFWGIFGRMLLFIILVMVVIFIPQIMSSTSNDSGVAASFGFLSFFIQIAIGWFGTAYFITLYKHALASAPAEKNGKLLIPIITSIIGWIIGILLIAAIITAVTTLIKNFNPANLPSQNEINAFQELKTNPALQEAIENPTEENMRKLLDLLPTGSPERAELERQIEIQFQGGSMTNDESMMPEPTSAQN